MADPAHQALFAGFTEEDIEALVDNGTIEIDTSPDPNERLVELTRRIATQYVDRFSEWADHPEDVEPHVAMQALADVDRLAESSGDAALQGVISELPRERAGRRWPVLLRTWIDRLGSVLGMRRG